MAIYPYYIEVFRLLNIYLQRSAFLACLNIALQHRKCLINKLTNNSFPWSPSRISFSVNIRILCRFKIDSQIVSLWFDHKFLKQTSKLRVKLEV